jgi:hypothetical protein
MSYGIPPHPHKRRVRRRWRLRATNGHKPQPAIDDSMRAGQRPESFCIFRLMSFSSAKRRLRATSFRSLPPTLSHEYAEQTCVSGESFVSELAARTILNKPIGRSVYAKTAPVCLCARMPGDMYLVRTRTYACAPCVWTHTVRLQCLFMPCACVSTVRTDPVGGSGFSLQGTVLLCVRARAC